MHHRESQSLECALHNAPATPAARALRGRRLSRRTATSSPLVVASAFICSSSPGCWHNQETSLGASLLDGRAHEPVNQFFQNHLARDCLRDFDHRRQIQVFDGRSDHARGASDRPLPPELRILLIELTHFAVGSPAQIAVPGFAQIRIRELFEPSCRIESCGNLVGDRLIVDEPVCVSGTDCLLVKAHCIEVATLDARYLRSHECDAVFEILRAVLRPNFELVVVGF